MLLVPYFSYFLRQSSLIYFSKFSKKLLKTLSYCSSYDYISDSLLIIFSLKWTNFWIASSFSLLIYYLYDLCPVVLASLNSSSFYKFLVKSYCKLIFYCFIFDKTGLSSSLSASLKIFLTTTHLIDFIHDIIIKDLIGGSNFNLSSLISFSY